MLSTSRHYPCETNWDLLLKQGAGVTVGDGSSAGGYYDLVPEGKVAGAAGTSFPVPLRNTAPVSYSSQYTDSGRAAAGTGDKD